MEHNIYRAAAQERKQIRSTVPQPEIDELCSSAVRIAADAGVELDYTDQSVARVQEFLDRAGEQGKGGALGRLMAVYLGETLCRNYLMRGRYQWLDDDKAGFVLKFAPQGFWNMEQQVRDYQRGALSEHGLAGFYGVCVITVKALVKSPHIPNLKAEKKGPPPPLIPPR